MGIAEDLEQVSTSQIWGEWTVRKGQVVPRTEDVTLSSNVGVELDAAYLYADLAQSSHLAQHLKPTEAASVIRAYLRITSLVIRHFKGEIRSFDGDRVMGIFTGDSMRNDAVSCALALNWAMEHVLRPDFELHFKKIPGVYLNQGIGIAAGTALLTRGGIRNNNDLVSIGEAPNVAAKFSDLRTPTYSTICITGDVRVCLTDRNRYSDRYTAGEDMFPSRGSISIGGKNWEVYSGGWMRKP